MNCYHPTSVVFLACVVALCEGGCSLIYDVGDLNGNIDSEEADSTECYWRINPGHPWTSIRLKFTIMTFDKPNDVLDIYQIEKDDKVLIVRSKGNAEFSGFTTGLGNGILIRRKTAGVSFRAEFQRFSAGMWSEVDENSIEAFCDSMDEPHVFHEYSCYVMHRKKETFPKAFTDGCGPHGHLALVNDRPTIEAISHELIAHTGRAEVIGGWVGFQQLYHSPEYEPDKGWYFKLPNGKQWLGENIMWSRHGQVFQPDNWHGNEQCGNLHYDKGNSAVFGGLNDAPCTTIKLTYECEYESLCACQPVLYTATDDTQFIKSPNYPKHYCPNMLCYYVVKAEDENHRIKLTLELLELGDYEWVEVFEDSTNTLQPDNVIKTWEGASLPSLTTVTSRTNSVIVKFRSFQGYNKGFSIAYQQDTHGVSTSKKSLKVDSDATNGGSGLKTAIIVLTCFVVVCVLIIAGLWYRRKRQRQRDFRHYNMNVGEEL